MANFQQTLGSQGTNIVISNENDLATLVAEKLFVKIKEDLIASGTGVISEELNGMKDKIEANKETNNQQLERLESIEDTTASNSARIQVLENDKPNTVWKRQMCNPTNFSILSNISVTSQQFLAETYLEPLSFKAT